MFPSDSQSKTNAEQIGAEQQSQVTKNLESMHRIINNIDSSIDRLNERLSSVLRLEPSQCNTCEEEKSELVPLAHTLSTFSNMLADIDGRINDMTNKLEI